MYNREVLYHLQAKIVLLNKTCTVNYSIVYYPFIGLTCFLYNMCSFVLLSVLCPDSCLPLVCLCPLSTVYFPLPTVFCPLYFVFCPLDLVFFLLACVYCLQLTNRIYSVFIRFKGIIWVSIRFLMISTGFSNYQSGFVSNGTECLKWYSFHT